MEKPVKILITEPEYFTEESIEAMEKIGDVVAQRMSRKKLLEAVKDVEILIVRIETIVDKELIKAAKKLKCVISSTTGLNHVDVSALNALDIPCFSLHGTHSISTAEHAISMLMSVARNIPSAHINLLNNSWDRWKYIGTEITGKTLGIFGFGRVGTEVAKRARGLLMNVISFDPYVTKSEMDKIGVKKVDWKTFLKDSDFITLHSPLTDETEGIIDSKVFDQLKPETILINTARGAIIDEKSLLDALKNNKIRGAGIDVYKEEPLIKSSPLKKYARINSNLVLTPHIAASTREAVANASLFAVESILTFLNKK